MENINIFLVFVEGVISFFSPCILPLIPLYLGYLTQNAKEVNEDGSISYQQGKVLAYTCLFILGISTTFFIAAFFQNQLAKILASYTGTIGCIGGILLIVLALIQIGIFKRITFTKEFRLPIVIKKMNVFTAYLLGFTFSFAWTPCIGPMLSSVMVLALSDATMGSFYIVSYALGFMIPFLLLGLFTSTILDALKKYRAITQYCIKLGGILLLVMGILLLGNSIKQVQANKNSTIISSEMYAGTDLELYNFSLPLSNGGEMELASQFGKDTIVSFIASWCPYCKMEIEVLNDLYKEGYNVVSIMTPKVGREVGKEELLEFIDSMDMQFPIMFDETGIVFSTFGASSLPYTCILQKDGNFLGCQAGYMEKSIFYEVMNSLD